MPTRILLIGAGSIGAFFGSRLATAPNVVVSALCRSNYDAVRASGFKVSSTQFGETIFRPENTFRNSEDIRKAEVRFDFVVVATKALPDLGDDSALLDGVVSADGESSIVLIQNGIGIEEPFRKRFPKVPILTAVTVASCAQPSAGFIRHNGWTRTSIGPYLPTTAPTDDTPTQQKTISTERTEAFVALLQQGGIKDAETYNHQSMQFVRWHKLAINAAMNASAVLSGGSDNREMATDVDLATLAKGVMNEVLDTASRILEYSKVTALQQLKLPTPDQILGSVKKNTSGSRPSMWHDWEKGRRMELEVILGNPIRIAREAGWEMPRVQTMYALLKKAQEWRASENKQQEGSRL